VAPESLSELIESIRTRVHAELDAQLPALAARHEEAVAAARREAEAQAERRRDEAVAAAREEVEAAAARRIAALTPPPPARVGKTILEAFYAIDAATTASDMLRAIAGAASAHHASLFVGPQLERWDADGRVDGAAAPDSIRGAFSSGRATRDGGGMTAPILLDGSPVAALHADSPSDTDIDALELLARYAAARLGSHTALCVAQAQRWLRSPAGTGAGGASESASDVEQGADEDDVQAARRYARLLVSEIKLYNGTAVDEGRTHRDLSQRLSAEIERARRLYEERVPSTIVDRARHFDHELIQTLAGGDRTLLG
jgi:hypothetical protein